MSRESKLLKQLVQLSDERMSLTLYEATDKARRQVNTLAFLIEAEINECDEDHTSVNKESKGRTGLIPRHSILSAIFN